MQGSSFDSLPPRRWLWFSGIVIAFAALFHGSAAGVVFHSRDEALTLAFPDADRVDARDLFLTASQRGAIEERSKTKLDSDLLTVYVGHRNGALVGYAFLDTHVVRTLPETFLIVLAPDGSVSAMHVLAFYEPTEYMPSEQWLKQFNGVGDGKQLRVGRDIAAITGSTLTSHAVTAAVRRVLAIYDVLLRTE